MTSIKTKAIFYAYSSNALDHLAPYAILCHQKKMKCVVIYGEDFVRHKVYPKSNIIKIFTDQNINSYDIPRFEKKGFIQTIFYYIWLLANICENKNYIPNYFKNKIKGLCSRVYKHLDCELIGKNIAANLLKDTEKVLVFTDYWNENKKIQNSFLLHMKDNATIISTGHAVWHWGETSIKTPSFCEDIALVSNHWEAAAKKFVKRKEIIGSLRFSKKWLTILDQYSVKKIANRDNKTRVVVLTHTEKYTNDWKRMFELLGKLAKRDDINLSILPHVRGMINMKPPIELKNAWDNKSTLDVSVKDSDIVIFWECSGIFEAVLRKKKIFFLSFLSMRKEKYVWKKNAPSNVIMKNEIELLNALDEYDKNSIINNHCFEEIIWPKGDPWLNASNFLEKTIES